LFAAKLVQMMMMAAKKFKTNDIYTSLKQTLCCTTCDIPYIFLLKPRKKRLVAKLVRVRLSKNPRNLQNYVYCNLHHGALPWHDITITATFSEQPQTVLRSLFITE